MHGSMLDRLLLWQKFAILSFIALLLAGIPTYLYIGETNKVIDAAKLEIDGLAPATAILKTIQLTQQHRGLSGLALSDSAGAAEKRAAKQTEVDQAMSAMSAIIKDISDPAIQEIWRKAQQDWTKIRTDVSGRSITASQSFANHSQQVMALLKVNELMADFYGLSLDPDADTYQLLQAMYFELPTMTEETGKLRARAAALLTKKEIALEDKLTLSGMMAKVSDRLAQTLNSYDKAALADAGLKTKVGTDLQQAAQLTNELLQLTKDKVINAESLSYASADYFNMATKAINQQFAVNEIASKVIAQRLDDKIGVLRFNIWRTMGILLAFAAMAALFARKIILSISIPLANATTLAKNVEKGDLTSTFEIHGTNETAQLMMALKGMNDSLVRIVSAVRQGTEIIDTASMEIASGNQDLSSRTESQASSLEETAASMEELTTTSRQNGDNARQASQLAAAAADVAHKGGAVVMEVVNTMNVITSSSKKISDIISVIDSIAFQTNILALNAAVEAARAGEQGRGFAVVASEVRNLAQRSAAAAKEINALISDSVEKVEAGSQLVVEAGSTMQEIVASVKKVTDMIGEISAASQEQMAGIEQINHAISDLDATTQHNAALVEQAAAAAESLRDQARSQSEVVSVFKLDVPAPARSRPIAERPVQRAQQVKPRSMSPAIKPAAARPVLSKARAAPKLASDDDWETF